MKTLWNIIAVVALANVFAIAGFVGWLVASDRLDTARVKDLRVMVAKTITQQKTEADEAQRRAEEEKKALEEAAKASRVPMTALEKLAARGEATELDHQRAERLKREIADLQRQLTDQFATVQKERQQLDADRAAFEEALQGSQQALNDAQFRKTLEVIAAMKPADAFKVLNEMLTPAPVFAPTQDAVVANNASEPTLAPARPPEAVGKVVGYLDAMEEQPRNKIIGEFVKRDPKLATELLEALRQRAQFARSSQDSPG